MYRMQTIIRLHGKVCKQEGGRRRMKIEITGSANEIAALVLAVQGRQKAESLTIGGVSTKAHGNDLIAEHGQNGEVHNGSCGFKPSIP